MVFITFKHEIHQWNPDRADMPQSLPDRADMPQSLAQFLQTVPKNGMAIITSHES